MKRPERRDTAGERRSALVALTVCLLVASGLGLLGAGAALSDARVDEPISTRTALYPGLVDQFYAAVNEALRSGDDVGLDELVWLDFLWCDPCPGASPGLDGFKRYLARLRQIAPAARLIAEPAIAVSREIVTARVRLTGYPLVAEPALWGPVETFRLAGGMIVERLGHPDAAALVDPLVRARLEPLPPAVTGVILARLTFAPGAGVDGLLSPGPTLFAVESGELALHAGPGSSILRADQSTVDGLSAEGGRGLDAVLRQGDTAIVPAGIRHSLHQSGDGPATAIGVTLFFDQERSRHISPRPPELTPFFPWDRLNSGTNETLTAPEVRSIAGGTVGAWPRGPVSVALGRAVLGPGAAIAPTSGETVVIAVEAGALDLGDGEGRRVPAGQGLLLPAGTEPEFRNPDDGMLILVMFIVAPFDP